METSSPVKVFTHRFCTDERFHNPVWTAGHSSEHQEAASRLTRILEELTRRKSAEENSVWATIPIEDVASEAEDETERVRLRETIGPLLELAHDVSYLKKLREICLSLRSGENVPLTPRLITKESDPSIGATIVSLGSYDSALAAVNTCIQAASWLTETDHARFAFCAVRPPGHHAGPSGPEERAGSCGFCLLNSAAILAAYLSQKGKRVAIVDFDVHHGNGTELCLRRLGAGYFYGSIHLLEVFENDPDSDFFPGTGTSEGNTEAEDHCWVINCPVEPLWVKRGRKSRKKGETLRGREGFFQALRDTLVPALRRFEPELLIISAGFDGAAKDEGNLCVNGLQTGLDLEPGDFATATRILTAECYKCLSLLEGGYGVFDPANGRFNRTRLVQCCTSHIEAAFECYQERR